MLVSRLFLVLLPLGCTVARADVTVESYAGLIFEITPPVGWTASASTSSSTTFAEALDSNGGFAQSYTSYASTALGLAFPAAFGLSGGGTTTRRITAGGTDDSMVSLPNQFDGFASSEAESVLSGSFEIVGAPGTVTPVSFRS